MTSGESPYMRNPDILNAPLSAKVNYMSFKHDTRTVMYYYTSNYKDRKIHPYLDDP